MSAGLWTWLQDADEVNTMKEGEGSECSCSSFTFCSSREGTSESGRLYRPVTDPGPLPLPLHSYNYIYPRPTHPSAEDIDSSHLTVSRAHSNLIYVKCVVITAVLGGVINCFATLHIKKDHLHVPNPFKLNDYIDITDVWNTTVTKQ